MGDRIFTVARASIVGLDDGSMRAWSEKLVRQDPNLKWVLGNFVEAERPNLNGHIFPLVDLFDAQESVAFKPLNMVHHPQYVVGGFAGAQMLNPDGEVSAAADFEFDDNGRVRADETDMPFMEALSFFWHEQFPEEYDAVLRAHKDGSLFYSMECIPVTVTCPDPDGDCGMTADFAGLESDTYCAHMNGRTHPKRLNKPHFEAGAMILPPVKPGWQRADIKTISRYLNDHQGEGESVYEAFKAAAPHLTAELWEQLMLEVMEVARAREFSGPQRQKMAKSGTAMPDGSFPIANEKDLRNAIQAIGRASDPASAKRHIKKRASALGLSKLIPEGW